MADSNTVKRRMNIVGAIIEAPPERLEPDEFGTPIRAL